MKKIGLIAGSGQFPEVFARTMISKGSLIYTAAYTGEASSSLVMSSTKLKWMYPGQVSKLVNFFKENSVTTAVMVGAIKKTRLLRNIRLDIKALSIIAKIKTTHDDTVMRAFANFLEKTGINIKAPTAFMPELIAKRGVWTKRRPSNTENKDIKIGFKVAKEIGRMDVGQSVIVGQGSVLAVEAIDGTDATIKRSVNLCRKKTVLVKVCKPNQDKRFDIPAVGLETIKNMYQHNVSTLAIESGKTVVFDKEKMIKTANKNKITIVCL